jgi:hypothetical protein
MDAVSSHLLYPPFGEIDLLAHEQVDFCLKENFIYLLLTSFFGAVN